MKSNLILPAIILAIFMFRACEEEPDRDNTPDYVPESRFEKEKAAGNITGDLNPFVLIDSPVYGDVSEFGSLKPEDPVLLLKASDTVYAYPHREMYVEVVNEDFGEGPVAITFCPLTRSGIAWSRLMGNDTLVLTASGYLYFENLMPMDTVTGTIFSQMLFLGLQGALNNRDIDYVPLLETTWETVTTYFPNARVLDGDASRRMSYQGNDLNKSMRNQDYSTDNIQYGLFDPKGLRLYNFEDFPGSLHVSVAAGKKFTAIVGSQDRQFITAFYSDIPLTPLEDEFPAVLEDATGNKYDIFGIAVEGPAKGTKLEVAKGFTAYDWAWENFYNDALEF